MIALICVIVGGLVRIYASGFNWGRDNTVNCMEFTCEIDSFKVDVLCKCQVGTSIT